MIFFLEKKDECALLFQIERLSRDILIVIHCIRIDRKLRVDIYYKEIQMQLLALILNRKKCRCNQFQHGYEFNYSIKSKANKHQEVFAEYQRQPYYSINHTVFAATAIYIYPVISALA